MIIEIGHLSLLLALTLSSFTILISTLGYINNWLNFEKLTFSLSSIIFFILLISFLSLVYGFLISDFSLITVWQNSHTSKPLIYKITGTWGNHEGSMLLWVLLLSFFGALISWFGKHLDISFKNVAVGVQTIILFLFLCFLIFTSNPFERTDIFFNEGKGLNPILQDPGLAFHPPFLYLGYVGLSVAFSFSVAALIIGKIDSVWARWVRPWTLVAWIFLTIGIALGSWWAYYELGWGGWWFWDPVENASLLPWLTASALLHTIVVADKKKIFINWTIILSILTFVLSLLGTFLVRSGVLVSVHAFANDPTRGVYILLLLASISFFGIFKYINKNIQLRRVDITLISREGMISLNNIFMLSLTFTILVGTIYPLFASVLFNSKISVGAPFFNSILMPVMFPFIAGMIIGPYTKWGKDDLIVLLNRIKILILCFFIISLLVWYLNYKTPILSIIFIALGCWIIFSSLFEVLQFINKKLRVPKKIFAQITAHIGIGLLIIGATGSSILKQEKIQFQEVGQSLKIKNFDVEFLGVKKMEGPNYISQMGVFSIKKQGEQIKILRPEKRFYNAGKQVTTEAAIHSSIFGDLYIAIGDVHEDKTKWTTRIWFNPFTIWIWIGVFFLAAGGSLSFLNSLSRK